ncbi:SelT/SelW/SelH family protein [Natronobacterium texcoconense]|uniref:Selenoprotein W-related protein n=1 Tax=Natronobacterium texcoconense TaxID=1095778 RepID=A0A1H1FIY0_NATTX|nr:Rdx family protein [Natronobacterium texcoconense]SDR00885.1 selenoprotein W-related protein [Natronobacterium texcoconense]
MVTVEIEYCVPCGFLSRAQDVQHALLSTFGEELEAVTLRTGANGVFVARVGDEVVFDKAEDEYDVDQIVRQVREHL